MERLFQRAHRAVNNPAFIGTLLADLVDTLLELLSDLKEWKLLWRNRDLLTSLRITSLVSAILLDHEATKASDLDPTTVNERVTHLAIHEVNDLFGLNYVDLRALSQFFDEF